MEVTRRRTLQGVGAAGVAGLAGTVVVSADEDTDGALEQVEQQDGTALRVAHVSPDTPSVEVRLIEARGTDTPSPDGADGTETPGGGGGEQTTGAEDPLIEDLGFGDVSDYTDVEPGTYQLQIVATGESGILDGIFGGGGQERVISDERVEFQDGTAYTAVAYGELARADLGETGAGTEDGTPGSTGAGAGGQETPAVETPAGGDAAGDGVLVDGLSFGDHEYVELEAGDHTLEFRESQAGGDDALGTATTPDVDETTPEDDFGGGDELTPGDGVTTPGDETIGEDDDRAFQVEVLEDELSVSGAGATATPGVEETPGDDGLGGEETPGDGAGGSGDQETSRLRIFHAVPDVEAMTVALVDQGDGGGGTPGGEEGTPTGQTPGDEGGAGETGGARVREAQISPEGGSVYSGFGTGYFDPEAASGGTTEGGDGTVTGDGGETPDGAGGDDELTEDVEGAEFEFVTVQDATDGERSDGGTGGGLFPSIEPAQASSD